jgi:hypothetical protein
MTDPVPFLRRPDGSPVAKSPTDFEGRIVNMEGLPKEAFVYWRCWKGIGKDNLETEQGTRIWNPWFIATLNITFEKKEGAPLTEDEINTSLRFFEKYRDAMQYAIVEEVNIKASSYPKDLNP